MVEDSCRIGDIGEDVSMKLFKYEGFEVRVAPEALTLKPFKKIWDRDKGKSKERALSELAFLYF